MDQKKQIIKDKLSTFKIDDVEFYDAHLQDTIEIGSISFKIGSLDVIITLQQSDLGNVFLLNNIEDQPALIKYGFEFKDDTIIGPKELVTYMFDYYSVNTAELY